MSKANITVGSVSITQTDFNRFSVVYSAHQRHDLSYEKAAAEFGACVMHQACNNGLLDNRTRAEAKAAGDTKPYFSGL